MRKNRRQLTRKQIAAAKARIVELLAQGSSIRTACQITGLGYQTYYNHLQRDPEFARQVEQAQAVAITQAESVIQAAIRDHKDVKVAMWYLERRCPEYRPPARMQVQHTHTIDAYELRFSVAATPETPTTFEDWQASIVQTSQTKSNIDDID